MKALLIAVSLAVSATAGVAGAAEAAGDRPAGHESNTTQVTRAQVRAELVQAEERSRTSKARCTRAAAKQSIPAVHPVARAVRHAGPEKTIGGFIMNKHLIAALAPASTAIAAPAVRSGYGPAPHFSRAERKGRFATGPEQPDHRRRPAAGHADAGAARRSAACRIRHREGAAASRPSIRGVDLCASLNRGRGQHHEHERQSTVHGQDPHFVRRTRRRPRSS